MAEVLAQNAQSPPRCAGVPVCAINGCVVSAARSGSAQWYAGVRCSSC